MNYSGNFKESLVAVTQMRYQNQHHTPKIDFEAWQEDWRIQTFKAVPWDYECSSSCICRGNTNPIGARITRIRNTDGHVFNTSLFNNIGNLYPRPRWRFTSGGATLAPSLASIAGGTSTRTSLITTSKQISWNLTCRSCFNMAPRSIHCACEYAVSIGHRFREQCISRLWI